MEDKIDLDAIIKKANGGMLPDKKTLERAKASYREAIHQALVLASEKSIETLEKLNAESFEDWTSEEKAGYMTALATIKEWLKGMPPKIEKLIV